MSAQVLGIGVGLFLLVSTWLVAFILCLVAIRTKKLIGFVALLVAAFVTIVLLIIPRRFDEDTVQLEQKESDYNFVWHNLLATFFGLCSVGSIVIFFTEYAIQPIHTSKIRSWIIE